jgi:ferrous iron transport protein A
MLSCDGAAGSIVAVEASRVAIRPDLAERVMVREAAGRREQGSGPGVPLTELPVGRSGRIVRIRACGPIRHHLLEMGVTRGARIFVERVAPLGDPIEVTVKGYYLAIRKDEARHIMVEP